MRTEVVLLPNAAIGANAVVSTMIRAEKDALSFVSPEFGSVALAQGRSAECVRNKRAQAR